MITGVKRGGVYKFRKYENEPDKYIVCLNPPRREKDKFVNFLFIGDEPIGWDVVKVKQGGKIRYVRATMITYSHVENLREHVSDLDDDTMKKIDSNLSEFLGLTHPDYKEKADFFENLYNDIITKAFAK